MTIGFMSYVAARCVRGPIVLFVVISLFLSLSSLLQVPNWVPLQPPPPQPRHEKDAEIAHGSSLGRSRREVGLNPFDDYSLSVVKDIDQRGSYQKHRMEKFCRNHDSPGGSYFPKNKDVLYQFKRHLIYDDNMKAIFCFVPKVGSTNMKRLMLYMSGNLPMETVEWPWVDNSIYLEPALKKASFLNNNLTEEEIMYRLRTYYKFMIVRDPLERIVSAYRNKLESPLKAPKFHNSFPERIKKRILERYRPNELDFWQKSLSFNLFNLSVRFDDYVRYLIETPYPELNEHFQPQFDICRPCFVNYDFYGNFKTYSADAQAIISRINANPTLYKDESLHSATQQTSQFVPQYYSTLHERELVRLLGSWYEEFAFYHTLYPFEQKHPLVDLILPFVEERFQ